MVSWHSSLLLVVVGNLLDKIIRLPVILVVLSCVELFGVCLDIFNSLALDNCFPVPRLPAANPLTLHLQRVFSQQEILILYFKTLA